MSRAGGLTPITVFFLATLLFTALQFFGTARAQYSLCNKTSYALSAAIGYADGGALLTRGWWRLRSGECKRVLSDPISPGRYFVYAEAIPGHVGTLRTWSGKTPLCVQNDSLFTLRDQDECADDPRRQREFFAVNIEDAGDGSHTTEFTDEKNFSTFDAEVAGVQRLLADVGLYRGKIDGDLGDNTRSAIRKYQSNKGLPRTGSIDGALVDALIEEANSIQKARGLTLCNGTMLPVWAALAEPTGKNEEYRSSGWWRLEGQECAKVRRGAIAAGAYYVYAVMEAESRSIPLAGGDADFCVADVEFEADSGIDCAEKGYDQAKFRRVELGASPSAKFEFTPELFNPDLAGR